MKESTLALSFIIIAPILFFGFFLIGFWWDSLAYNQFQDDLHQEFQKLNNQELKFAHCHEGKCFINFVDPKMDRYSFLLSHSKYSDRNNIQARLNLMQIISKNFDKNRNKCRYIQVGTNICQL